MCAMQFCRHNGRVCRCAQPKQGLDAGSVVQRAEFLLYTFKDAESSAELKGLDADAMATEQSGEQSPREVADLELMVGSPDPCHAEKRTENLTEKGDRF